MQVELAPGLGLNDSDIESLTAVDAENRSGVHVFIAGDPLHLVDETVALDITDAGVKKLCQAYPNLEVVKLMSTHKLGSRAFPEIVLNCTKIEAVTITAKEGSKANLDEDPLINYLLDKSYRPTLRYLEFRGVHFPRERHNWLAMLTMRRPELEIVFQHERIPAWLVRDMGSTPLSKVPEQKDVDEGDEDDDQSDEEARKKRRENARYAIRAGYESAMRSMMGDSVYDYYSLFQEDDDFDSELDPDDDGIDDERFEEMMARLGEW